MPRLGADTSKAYKQVQRAGPTDPADTWVGGADLKPRAQAIAGSPALHEVLESQRARTDEREPLLRLVQFSGRKPV